MRADGRSVKGVSFSTLERSNSNVVDAVRPPDPTPPPPPRPLAPLDDNERLLSLQIALKLADIGMVAEGREVRGRS